MATKGEGRFLIKKAPGMSRRAERRRVAMRKALLSVRPTDRESLRGWVKALVGVEVPGCARCVGHATPLDYLERAFFELPGACGDLAVWANRGGGKTFYGAVATLLDLLFKPGVEVRILGGSLEQSRMMYVHLERMLRTGGLVGQVEKMNRQEVVMRNGSRAELLAQAETSVRGHRVQKLRCDEVELFDRDVWQACQFVTRSAVCGGVPVRGTVEVLSTMHRPFGLMNEIVGEVGSRNAERGTPGSAGDHQVEPFRAPSSAFHVLKWCALDVMGVCPAEISCDGCVLWEECGGRAKGWRGFLKAEDVLAQRRRSSKLAFESEMLCVRPSRADNVFPMFSLERHVVEVEPGRELVWVGGIDFGMRNVTVVLFAQLVPTAGGTVRVEVVDEYVQDNRTTEENLKAAAARGWPRLAWIGADPAGNSRSSQTGQSEITVARKLGWKVRDARSRIGVGVEIIRRRLENGRGDDGLVIHPRCGRLIQSLVEYHYDIERPSDENPVKDGKSDHAVDALRYLLVNLESGKSGKAVVGRY